MKNSVFVRMLGAAVLVAGGVVVTGAPASAAALTNVGWSISKPHPGDSGVRYSWNFTTATLGTIRTVAFDVPAGTSGGALSVTDVYGITAGGTASLSGTTVTYTMASGLSVGPGVNVLVAIDGFTNTATPGTYASTVTTQTSVPATIDTAGSNTVSVSNNSTSVTVKVARSTGFSLNTTGFTMMLDPSVPALTDRTQPVTLSVMTNAANGYALDTRIDHQLQGSGATMAASSAGKATGFSGGAFPVNTFGYTVGVTGAGTANGAGFASTGYVGYTTAGETVASATGPTNGDTVTLTNRARVDFLQKSDAYTGTVTYTVTPSY
ncbi:hypothetical protein [Actinoplanes sp. NBRC 103695]|uniref:hypothetical protein n=1 Tax=Actinoplanes sp. NBRC 103695 TaxID=3032202 RepID=UPI0024A4E205|nr:hypothetical protein [Actinoplanes sp. NBRC 103695]GLZ00200.1 hypothetical protein Acsp02_74520 [Actinoplanes sp. NBRC 103695]